MTAERKKNSKIDGRSKCIENKDKERERGRNRQKVMTGQRP